MVPEYKRPETLVALATRLSDLGYWPVPIPAGCKGPTINGWQNLRLNFDNIPDHFAGAGLVGILHNNVLALDIDVYDPGLSAEIVNEGLRRFPGALERIGQAPKSALFLRMNEPGFKSHNTGKYEKDGLSAQVEVRSVSRQIVVYGKHPDTGKTYSWPRGELWATPWADLPEADRDDIEQFRDWCEDKIKRWAGVSDPKIIDLGLMPGHRSQQTDEPPAPDVFREALTYVPANVGYDDWLSGLMGIHDYYSGSAEGLQCAQEWSSAYADYNPREVETKWKSFEPGKGTTFKSVLWLAKQNGADLAAIRRKLEPVPSITTAAELSEDFGAPATEPDRSRSGAEAEPDWKDTLIRNSRGRALWNTFNALTMLGHDEGIAGCFAFDEFKQVKVLTRPIPFSGERAAGFKGRELKDSDTTQTVSYFNRVGFPDATKTIAADAIQAACEASVYHPVRGYLEGLPAWDGLERLERWLETYCAAPIKDSDHAAYVRAVGRKWLISAVARIMQPGCKADGVLILEGRQGAMKSTTLRTLSGPDWFGDSLPPMHSKDASDYLRGKWIVEMAELSNINKSEVEVVKAFIAREEERFRPAYARNEITYPRQCVFAGSTNKSDYLRDETGNRRFWPVKVGAACNVDALALDRDALWAEALHLYKSGERWWLDRDTERTAERQQAERVSQDGWEGNVLSYLTGKIETSPTSIAQFALGIEIGRIDRPTTNRITAILTSNGWTRSGRFTAGDDKGRARFVKEED